VRCDILYIPDVVLGAGEAMRRREFISLVCGATIVWPLTAPAQQPERLRRIGVLISTREDDPDGQARAAVLRQGLSELGWTEGRNIHIDYRRAGETQPKRRPMLQNWSVKSLT
jgi:putative ABC transport system substrate-binding protein